MDLSREISCPTQSRGNKRIAHVRLDPYSGSSDQRRFERTARCVALSKKRTVGGCRRKAIVHIEWAIMNTIIFLFEFVVYIALSNRLHLFPITHSNGDIFAGRQTFFQEDLNARYVLIVLFGGVFSTTTKRRR